MFSTIEIENTGSKPIMPADFESPMEIRPTTRSRIVNAKLEKTRPKYIEANISFDDNRITIAPVLLNPGDKITISLISSGEIPAVEYRARIAGLSSIDVNSQQDPMSFMTQPYMFLAIAIVGMLTHIYICLRLLAPRELNKYKRRALWIGAIVAFISMVNFYQATAHLENSSMYMTRWGIVMDGAFFIALVRLLISMKNRGLSLSGPREIKPN